MLLNRGGMEGYNTGLLGEIRDLKEKLRDLLLGCQREGDTESSMKFSFHGGILSHESQWAREGLPSQLHLFFVYRGGASQPREA